MKIFNCIETIAKLDCKQISSNSFENEIIYELFTYLRIIHIYTHIYSQPQTDLFRSIRTHQCG